MSPVHAVPVVAPPHTARLWQLVPLRGYSMFLNTDLINTKPFQRAVIMRDLPHKTHACAPNGIIMKIPPWMPMENDIETIGSTKNTNANNM
jgi:hypothetical protein